MVSRPLNGSLLGLAVAGVLAALLLLGPAAASSHAARCKGSAVAGSKLRTSKAERATLCLLNKQRSKRGLGKLHSDGKQADAASRHNEVMVRSNCFSHLCPGEKDLIGRIVATGYLPCVCTWLVGENIAWGKGGAGSPRGIVKAWMKSAPHRENILNPKFDEIGVAVDHGSPVAGHGDGATYTTDFGFKS